MYTELEKELGTVVAYLQNQGETRCHALFLLCKEILLLCLLSHIHLVVRHIPGTFNVLADCLSRFHNPVNTEWELRQVVFDSVVLRWDRPHVDLFATSLNHKLETFVSPVPDPLSFAVDTMSLSWDSKEIYSFCPKSGPPSKEIVLPIADMYPLIVEGTNCLISNKLENQLTVEQ
jgi:hypothetical protein